MNPSGTTTPTRTLHVHEYQPGNPDGPTLVLLHGFPVDHRMFDPLAPHLAPGVRVLGVDLPGLGQSRKILPDPPSLDTSADLVMAAVGTVTGPLIVAGLSMGGYVAQAIAALHGPALSGLILLDTRMNADPAAAAQNRLRVADQAQEEGTSEVVAAMAVSTLAPATAQERPAIVELMESLIEDQTGAGVAWSQRAMAVRPDRAAVLAALDIEVLMIVGEDDEISAPDVMAQMAATAKHAKLEIVPDAGHMAPVEQPLAVAKIINEYLARVG